MLHNYVNLNIGLQLALGQAVANFVQWTIIGIVIGLIYKPLATPTIVNISVVVLCLKSWLWFLALKSHGFRIPDARFLSTQRSGARQIG